MFGIEHFTAFLAAGILLNIIPGSDTMYVLNCSMSYGRKSGVLSAMGIGTGCLVHIIFATVVTSVILKESDMLFKVLQYAGALYLVYMGVRMFIHNDERKFDVPGTEQIPDVRRAFVTGALNNILNPKLALFFLAFLPQFLQKGYEPRILSFIVMGFLYNFSGTFWNLMLAFFPEAMSEKIKAHYRVKTWIERVAGLAFIFIAVQVVL